MTDKEATINEEGAPMNALLEAADGYVPILQSLLWIVFLAILAFAFRHQLKDILVGIKNRIDSGSKVKVGGFEVGQLVTKTADLSGDVKTFGNPDDLKLLFKVRGAGWKKSTKALQLPNGCMIQVTTERQDNDGHWANSEAIVFVPAVRLEQTENGTFRVVEQ